MPYASRIAELLINTNAIHISVDPPFTWATGVQLPVYCDTRMLYSHPDARNIVVQALVDRMNALHIEPDAIAGTATGAIGWATLVADRLGLPLLYVRRNAKLYGLQKQVEGEIAPEKHIAVIEDVIVTGASSIQAAEALRHTNGAIVTDIVSVFSYEMEVALENAQQAAVKLHAISTLSNLLDIAVEQGRLDSGILKQVQQFSKNPEEWVALH